MVWSQQLISVGLLIILFFQSGVDGGNGYYHTTVDQCRSSSKELSDVEYIRSSWFNKAEYLRFNSTVGNWEGYTAFGVQNAEIYNKDTSIMGQMRAEKDRVCRQNLPIDFEAILSKTGEPEVVLSLAKPSSSGHPAVLMCSAYDFYPKMIKLTWYRDGQEVTGSVISSEELADGDWYYQIHSHLEFTPKAGEKISCMVEHTSLKEPKVIPWDSSMPEPERNKIAIGAAGLVLGVIIALAGFIYYKKKSRTIL
ncbi:H-2 class II histocompatibility antigen, A-S beta chain-like [Engraulis encrasicolus]|uniref:H-2 class II histocompatibility antigen, A-S beta chain-like n=1 Tax=Engraulis encrasicolus TaxID=184585 RepID=UPI002FD4B7EC